MTRKRVKAWVVLGEGETILGCGDTKPFLELQWEVKKKSWRKLIPCTISYTLPKRKARGK